MSSHHIIRDEQEPAVILADFWHDSELLGELLAWSPLLVALPAALPSILRQGTKVDAACCSPTLAHQHHEELAAQWPVQLLDPKPDPLRAAVEFLAHKKVTAVNLLVKANLGELPKLAWLNQHFETVCYTPQFKATWLSESKFSKWVSAGTHFQLSGTASATNVQGLSAKGSAFEATKDGMIGIHTAAPCWLAEFWLHPNDFD